MEYKSKELETLISTMYDKEADYDTRLIQLKEISEKSGKSYRGLAGHLSTRGIHKAKKYERKDKKPIVNKDIIAEEINEEGAFQFSENEVGSLSKATKSVLYALLAYVKTGE